MSENIKRPKRQDRFTEQQAEIVCSLHAAGVHPAEIAKIIRKTEDKVRRFATYQRLGAWTYGHRPSRRKQNPIWGKRAAPITLPGDIVTYTDASGYTVRRYPPAYAVGVRPQKNIGCRD